MQNHKIEDNFKVGTVSRTRMLLNNEKGVSNLRNLMIHGTSALNEVKSTNVSVNKNSNNNRNGTKTIYQNLNGFTEKNVDLTSASFDTVVNKKTSTVSKKYSIDFLLDNTVEMKNESKGSRSSLSMLLNNVDPNEDPNRIDNTRSDPAKINENNNKPVGVVIIKRTGSIASIERVPKNNKQEVIYPSLPDKSVLLDLIEQCNNDIKKEEQRIRALSLELESFEVKLLPLDSVDLGSSNCIKFNNVLYYQNTVERIINHNREMVRKVHNRPFLHNGTGHVYNNINELPYFIDMTNDIDDVFETITNIIKEENNLVQKKNQKLTGEYLERMEIWNKSVKIIDKYHQEAYESVHKWPSEFVVYQDYDRDGTAVIPDMLTDSEKVMFNFYDYNNLVEDPVREHNEYKRRVSWTLEEEKVFVDRYANSPRDFKKIAASLPGKTLKHVIEYYFLNRKRLGIRAFDPGG